MVSLPFGHISRSLDGFLLYLATQDSRKNCPQFRYYPPMLAKHCSLSWTYCTSRGSAFPRNRAEDHIPRAEAPRGGIGVQDCMAWSLRIGQRMGGRDWEIVYHCEIPTSGSSCCEKFHLQSRMKTWIDAQVDFPNVFISSCAETVSATRGSYPICVLQETWM